MKKRRRRSTENIFPEDPTPISGSTSSPNIDLNTLLSNIQSIISNLGASLNQLGSVVSNVSGNIKHHGEKISEPDKPLPGEKAFGSPLRAKISGGEISYESVLAGLTDSAKRVALTTKIKDAEPVLKDAEQLQRLDLFKTMFSPTGIVS